MFRYSLLVIFCLAILGANPCFALTNEGELSVETRQDFLESGFALPEQKSFPGSVSKVFSHFFKTEYFHCPIIVNYPQELGNKTVDAAVEAKAQEWFKSDKEDLTEPFQEAQELEALVKSCQDGSLEAAAEPKVPQEEVDAVCKDRVMQVDVPVQKWFSIITYELTRPSPKVVSVAFTTYMYGGGAHDNWAYYCMTFDTEKGRQLQLVDVFPESAKHVELAALVGKKLAVEKGIAATEEGTMSLEEANLNMSRISLTAEGAIIWYAPYEQGGFSEGSFIIKITKEELATLGANMLLWQ